MTCGIYQILNIVTKKCYVGSALKIESRWKDHKKMLKGGSGHHSIKLQRAWNKYGPEAFEWNILQECEEAQLTWLEAFWMDRLNSVGNGYNSSILTLDDGLVIRSHTEETRAKLRGRKHTEETKKKISLAGKGRVKSETERLKHSQTLKGRKASEDTKKKMREAKLGKKRPEETRVKIKEAKLHQSDETRKKNSLAQRGKVVSEETRKKISLRRRNDRTT
jgi:group I intron endonuclease